MEEPRYLRAVTADEAIAALAEAGDGGLIVAGGIVVGSLINQRLASPSVLIDITRIAGMRGIALRDDGTLAIGALTTHDDILRSETVRKAAPLLSEIAPDIACARLRNRGTLGGSLCTIGGQGDPATGLIALAARLRLQGTGGERSVALEDFYKDGFRVDLEPGEIVREVLVPPPPPGSVFGFCKLGPRNAMDWTQITASVALTLGSDGRITRARIGVNGAAATPVRPRAAEAALAQCAAIDWNAVTAALDREIDPQTDLIYSEKYKRHLAAVSLRRATEQAMARIVSVSGRD